MVLWIAEICFFIAVYIFGIFLVDKGLSMALKQDD